MNFNDYEVVDYEAKKHKLRSAKLATMGRYLSLYFILLILQTMELPAQERNTGLLLVECEIIKIDSVGDYYVIYAKNISEKYKIVSKKDSMSCQNIVVGEFYKITLDLPILQPMNPTPVTFSGGAVIIPYGWGKTLYFPLDIRGLCYNIEFKSDILKKRNEIEEQEPLKAKNKRERKKYFEHCRKEIEKEKGNTLYYEENPLIEWD